MPYKNGWIKDEMVAIEPLKKPRKPRPKITKREMYQQCLALALMLGEDWDELTLDAQITEQLDPDEAWDISAFDLIREGYIKIQYVVTQKGLDKINEQPKKRGKAKS